MRNIKSPIVQVNCGGGIWRTKYWDEKTVGLACMHSGSRLYEFEKRNSEYAAAALIGGHYEASMGGQTRGHLAYGIAVMQAPFRPLGGSDKEKGGNYGTKKNTSKAKNRNTNRWVCASCSFYDDLVSLWSLNPS